MGRRKKPRIRYAGKRYKGFRVPFVMDIASMHKIAEAANLNYDNLKVCWWRLNNGHYKTDKIPHVVMKAFNYVNARIVKEIAAEEDETLRLLAVLEMKHPNLGPYDMKYSPRLGCVWLKNREDPEEKKIRVDFNTLQATLLYNALVKGFELEIIPQN